MICIEELKKEYADKLSRTGSMDAALLKVVWLAYQQGQKDERALKEDTPEKS